MRTHCNPGCCLQVEGSFRLIRPLLVNGVGRIEAVVDKESGERVTLEQLLEQFLEDAGDPGTGPIRVTVEPAGSF